MPLMYELLDNVPTKLVATILGEYREKVRDGIGSRRLEEEFVLHTALRRRVGDCLVKITKAQVLDIIRHWSLDENRHVVRKTVPRKRKHMRCPRFYKIESGPMYPGTRAADGFSERSYGCYGERFVNCARRRELIDEEWRRYAKKPVSYFDRRRTLNKKDACKYVANRLRSSYYPVQLRDVSKRVLSSLSFFELLQEKKGKQSSMSHRELKNKLREGSQRGERFWRDALSGVSKQSLQNIILAASYLLGSSAYKKPQTGQKIFVSTENVCLLAKVLNRIAGSQTKLFSRAKRKTIDRFFQQRTSTECIDIRTSKDSAYSDDGGESEDKKDNSSTESDEENKEMESEGGAINKDDIDVYVNRRVVPIRSAPADHNVYYLLRGFFACHPTLLERLFATCHSRHSGAKETLKQAYDRKLYFKLRENLRATCSTVFFCMTDSMYSCVVKPVFDECVRSAFEIYDGYDPLPSLSDRKRQRVLALRPYSDLFKVSEQISYGNIGELISRRLESTDGHWLWKNELQTNISRRALLASRFGTYLDSIGDLYPTKASDNLPFVNTFMADDAAVNFSDNRVFNRACVQVQAFRNTSRWSAAVPIMQMCGGDEYDNCFEKARAFFADCDRYMAPEGVVHSVNGQRVRIRILKFASDSKTLRSKMNTTHHGWTILSPAHSMSKSEMRMTWTFGQLKHHMLYQPGISHFGDTLRIMEEAPDSEGGHGVVCRPKLMPSLDARNGMIGPFHTISTIAKNVIYLWISALRTIGNKFLDALQNELQQIRYPNRTKVSWCVRKGQTIIFTEAGVCRDLVIFHVARIFRRLSGMVCNEHELSIIDGLKEHATIFSEIARTFAYAGFTDEYLLRCKQLRSRCLMYNELTICLFGAKWTKAQIYFVLHAAPYHVLTLARHLAEVSVCSEEALEMTHCVVKRYNRKLVTMLTQSDSEGWQRFHKRTLSLLLHRIERVCDVCTSPVDAYKRSKRGYDGRDDMHTDFDTSTVETSADNNKDRDECDGDGGTEEEPVTIQASDFLFSPIHLNNFGGRCPPAIRYTSPYISFVNPDCTIRITKEISVCLTGRRSRTERIEQFLEVTQREVHVVPSKHVLRCVLTSSTVRVTFEIPSDAVRQVSYRSETTSHVMFVVDFAIADVWSDARRNKHGPNTHMWERKVTPSTIEKLIETSSRAVFLVRTERLQDYIARFQFLGICLEELGSRERLPAVIYRNDPKNVSVRKLIARRAATVEKAVSFPIVRDGFDPAVYQSPLLLRKKFCDRIRRYHTNQEWIKFGYAKVPQHDRILESFSFCACGSVVGINLFGDLVDCKYENDICEVIYDEKFPHGRSHALCPVATRSSDAPKATAMFFRRERVRARGGKIKGSNK